MSPKPRDSKNKRLEGTNIKVVSKGDNKYYYYVMPDNTRIALAHNDLETSIEVAIALNKEFRNESNIYDRILACAKTPKQTKVTENPLLTDAVDMFKEEWLPKQGYAENSERERVRKLKRWKKRWENKRVDSMTTFVVATFLRELPNDSARQHRILFDQFFRWCASSGFKTQKPMVEIEKIKQEKRKRKRHNWEAFKAIYDASPEWLQIAQDAALYTLQRRSDLVAISFDNDINVKDKTIRVLQDKSENYDEQVFIDIIMGDELYDTVMRSHWSGINCPYLVHMRPTRITKTSREAKLHPFAVMPDYLTRAYSKVRDDVGVYNHIEDKKERPGLHSIRALGIWLYTKANYSDDYIMALAGHADERMKAHYFAGHEKKKPTLVEAGLSLSEVDLTDIDWETDLSEPLKKLADEDE